MAEPLVRDRRVGERAIRVIRPPSLNPLVALSQLRGLTDSTDLFLTLCLHRFHVRYKQSILGVAWALLQPLALMLVYFVIFSVVAQMPSEGIPYPIFVFSGLLPWLYFSTSVTAATSSLVSHIQIITKVYFPRELLPLSYVLIGLVDFIIASSLLALLMVYYQIPVTWQVLWTVPILLVETVLITALSLLFSAVQVRFRDLGFAMALLMQIWMFASPVVYPLSRVPERYLPLYLLNPMAGILENFRSVVIQGVRPDLSLLGEAAIISGILLFVAYVYFKTEESTMADVI